MTFISHVIEIKGMVAGFKNGATEVAVLSNVSGTVRASEMVSIIGANGSGKSTLLRTIAGLIPPLGGDLELYGMDLREYSRTELAMKYHLLQPVQHCL
ncbi:MAG: ATP-binding cassette domain-containing protein [Bacteroidales bacterium]